MAAPPGEGAGSIVCKGNLHNSCSRPFDEAPFRGRFHVDGNAVSRELS